MELRKRSVSSFFLRERCDVVIETRIPVVPNSRLFVGAYLHSYRATNPTQVAFLFLFVSRRYCGVILIENILIELKCSNTIGVFEVAFRSIRKCHRAPTKSEHDGFKMPEVNTPLHDLIWIEIRGLRIVAV